MDPKNPTRQVLAIGNVVVHDVVDLMPHALNRRGATRKQKRDYGKKRTGEIQSLIIHHSGRSGAKGFQGYWNSSRFVVDHRGMPLPPYMWWASEEPDRDDWGRFIVYKGLRADQRAWHSGSCCLSAWRRFLARGGIGKPPKLSANDQAAAWAFQGNTTKKPLSAPQVIMANAVIPHIVSGLPQNHLWTHSTAEQAGGRNKKPCPGLSAESWVSAFNEGVDLRTPNC